MEMIEKGNNLKIFSDGKSLYYLKNISLDEKQNWVLVKYVSSMDDENAIRINASIDENGTYERIKIQTQGSTRLICLEDNMVLVDAILIQMGGYEEYYSTGIQPKQSLPDYVAKQVNFEGTSKKPCYVAVTNNLYLRKFLESGKLLSRTENIKQRSI